MAVSTDTFNFNNTKMFEKIRAGLSSDRTKTQNLLDCKDDLLFAWDSADCSLLVINWRAAEVKGFDEIKFQTLMPSIPQNFQVEKILTSPEGSLIVLAGARGLSILEVPRRWGPNGQFMEGNDKVMCRSHNLDEQFFANNSHLELLQIRWHPASPTDSHILAMLSDNTIRVYDEATLRHVWRVGPVPCSVPPTGSTVPSLHSMGETAVDFDIAPPRVVSSGGNDDIKDSRINNSTYVVSDKNNTSGIAGKSDGGSILTEMGERVEWPLVILRGNGNIYVLCAGIDTDKPHLQGPLTIVPQTDDNYGVDSCSVLVIPSTPPALVIAETTGKLHHALLLDAEETEESFTEVDCNLNIYPSEWTVNVLETVELELGLPDSKKNKSHTCPIHLKRDFINELRYFAYHNTGLHVITMNFIKELQRFVDTEGAVDSLSLGTLSHAEYIVCTKVEDKSKINAVLGFVLLQMPSGIILLLSSGEVISLNIIIDLNLLSEWSLPRNKNDRSETVQDSPIQKIMSESFVSYIHGILKKTVNQPILSLDKSSDLAPQESYELLTQAVQTLRDHYFKKHEKARTEILKRVKILKMLKMQQTREIENLEKEKDTIRHDAERLAEKYEDLYEKQQSLSRRCQELVRQTNICLPNNSLVEKKFRKSVEKINEKTTNMAKQLRQAQEKIKTQQLHTYDSESEEPHKNNVSNEDYEDSEISERNFLSNKKAKKPNYPKFQKNAKKFKRRRVHRIGEAFGTLQYEYNKRKDTLQAYGEYITGKLESLDPHSCAYVQKIFAEVLYDAEMGQFK